MVTWVLVGAMCGVPLWLADLADPLEIAGQPYGVVLREGEGAPAAPGDRITLEFNVRTTSGRELADTGARGLTYTFRLADPDADPALSQAALGMRPGERRWVWLPSPYGREGAPPFVPAGGIQITLERLPNRG